MSKQTYLKYKTSGYFLVDSWRCFRLNNSPKTIFRCKPSSLSRAWHLAGLSWVSSPKEDFSSPERYPLEIPNINNKKTPEMSMIWGVPELCPFCFLTGFHNPKQTWWRRDPITCSIRPASGGTPVQPGKQTFCSPENGPTEQDGCFFLVGSWNSPFSVGGMQHWSGWEKIYRIISGWLHHWSKTKS